MQNKSNFTVVSNDTALIKEIEEVFRARIDMALRESGLNLRLDCFNLVTDAPGDEPHRP